MRVSHSHLFAALLLLMFLAALGTPALATPALAMTHDGLCASAEIDRPFALPDGTRHPSGTLKLCFTRDYNPISSLHETFVDRMPVGMFVSRREVGELSHAEGYFMVFQPVGRGPMRLAGLVASGGNRTERFFMEQGATVTVEDSVPRIAGAASSSVLVPATAR